jgi:hypothetical protein
MKSTVFPHTVAFLVLSTMVPLSAQNLGSTQNPAETRLTADGVNGTSQYFTVSTAPSGSYEVPAIEKIQGEVAADAPVFAAQDAVTLETKATSAHPVESVVDLDVLRKPSPFRKVLVSTHGNPEIEANSLQNGLALISATYRESGKTEKSADCSSIALSVGQRVKQDPSKVLEIVEAEVAANPDCSCEIVKTAIKSSEADVQQVVAIVEAAIHASPESMRIISQCAIAAMPDSINEVQALLAKLDPNAGETGYSSKGSKSSKSSKITSIVAPALPNPLDRPPTPLYPPLPPTFPPSVTSVDPCERTY